MRLLLSILAAAIAFFAAAPVASALTLQTNRSAADDAQVADPNDVRPHLQGQQMNDNGWTTKIGNTTLHIGVSQGGRGDYGGNNWFLESPASRTVPSQAR